MRKTHRILMSVLGASGLLGLTASPTINAGPAHDQPVWVNTSLDKPVLISGGEAQKVVIKIEVKGGGAPQATRQPLNLAVVLDRSGSMSGAKMEQAKQAASLLVDQLGHNDIFSLVAYDSDVEVLVAAARVGHRQSQIKKTIQGIHPSGSTALYDGVVEGDRQLREFFDKQQINRVILLSDGIANVGPSSHREITSLGTSLIQKGISVTTIGLGDSYNEDLMTALAEASDANYYYVADVESLTDVFIKELGELKRVVARDIEIEFTCPEGVRPIRFLGRHDEPQSRSALVKFATLSSEQTRELFLECEVSANALDKITAIGSISVQYQKDSGSQHHSSPAPVRVTYTKDQEVAESAYNTALLAEAAIFDNSRQTELAIAMAEAGDVAGARAQINSQTSHLRRAMANAPSAQQMMIQEEIETLERAEDQLTTSGFAPMARKQLSNSAYKRRNAKE